MLHIKIMQRHRWAFTLQLKNCVIQFKCLDWALPDLDDTSNVQERKNLPFSFNPTNSFYWSNLFRYEKGP